MKKINNYILEKLHIGKNYDAHADEIVWLVLYEYDYEKNDFIWKTFDINSYDEMLDDINDKNMIYNIFKDVPNKPDIIDEILKAKKDYKLDNITFGKYNNILRKYKIEEIDGNTVFKMINNRVKRLRREQRKIQ